MDKTPGTISLREAIAGIVHLRQLHVQMDNAVLAAYGWAPTPAPSHAGHITTYATPHAAAQSPIALRHDFYEVDYLPEGDRIRFTIHPDARKEILKRLLELNHKIHAQEVASGLWDKKKPSPKKPDTANEPNTPYNLNLFGE